MQRCTWLALLFVVLAALPGRAQETRGNITGIVQDQDGVIPGVVVRVTNTATGQTQQVVTNSGGYFEAVLLNPGTYEVRAELQGYKTYAQTGISPVGQIAAAEYRLNDEPRVDLHDLGADGATQVRVLRDIVGVTVIAD